MVSILRPGEDGMTMLDDELHGQVLGMHVGHLLLETVIPHDGGREDDGQVLGRHLINS